MIELTCIPIYIYIHIDYVRFALHIPRLADVVKCVSKLYSVILVWETDLLYAKEHLFGLLHIYPDLSFLETLFRVPGY